MQTSQFLKTLVVVGLLAMATHAAQDGDVTQPSRRFSAPHTILVTGSADLPVRPDEAIVRFGMTAQNSKASVAQSKVNEVIQKATDAIEKLGVKRYFIRSARVSLTPIYSDKLLSSGGSKVSSFRADNTLEVTVTDINTVGEIIDAAVNAGANEVQGVRFILAQGRDEHREALASAAREAKAKAEKIAEGLGLTLGNVIEANETTALPFIESAGPTFAGATPRTAFTPTPVEPGQLRIQAQVTVRYEIATKRPE